jgi:type II secretory pathway pseudopilin PulG
MKRQAGFTMVEFLIAMGVTLVVLLAAAEAFQQAMQMNANTTLAADMYDNLRSGMNIIVQDLIQTGAGIPTGGIPIPSTPDPTSGCNKDSSSQWINRPPMILGLKFNGPNSAQLGCNTVLPAIEPGNNLGPQITSPDGTTGPVTDIINLLYIDNTIPANVLANTSDANPPLYNALDACFIGYNYVKNGKACQNGNTTCTGNGVIAADGSSVTFDSTCQTIGASGIPINPGDLIMFYNNNGFALQTVTKVSGQTLYFASGSSSGDSFNLNGRNFDTAGTISQLQNTTAGKPNGTYPNTTSATRIWMITYYLDNSPDSTGTSYPHLMREVNFNPPEPVGEAFENLQFTYNFADGTPPSVSQPTVPISPNYDLENQIRSVNVYLGVRSAESSPIATGPWGGPSHTSTKFIRSSLDTQVDLRPLAYFNNYQTGYSTGSNQ